MHQNQLSNCQSFIIGCRIAGISINEIKLILKNRYNISVMAHDLTQYIKNNLENWITDLAMAENDVTCIFEAVHKKKINRTSSRRKTALRDFYFEVLDIIDDHNTIKSALHDVNNLLEKNGKEKKSYDSLCLFVRSVKDND